MPTNKEVDIAILKTLLDDDIESWLIVMSEVGLVPVNKTVQNIMFYRACIQETRLPNAVRLNAREKLKAYLASPESGVSDIMDDIDAIPITILERLMANPDAYDRTGQDMKSVISEEKNIVFVLPGPWTRDKLFMTVALRFAGILDLSKSNAVKSELYTLGGTCMKFCTENESYEPPSGRIAYMVVPVVI